MVNSYSSPLARLSLKASLTALGFGGALLLAPAAYGQITTTTPRIEAETSTLTGGAVVVAGTGTLTGTGSASGTGYVDYNGVPSGVNFAYTAATAGLYEVLIRYESQYDFKLGTLSANGGAPGQVYFKSTKTGANFLSTSRILIRLVAGANTITIAGGYNYYGIDYIQVAPAAATLTALAPSSAGRVEAELGQLFYTQAIVKDGDAAGSYSGTGYVSSFSETTSLGSSLTLPITVATAGLYQIAVGARGLFDAKSFDVAVATATYTGGNKLTTPLGAGSPAFQSYVVGKYNLTAGTNTITLTTQTSYIDVDYVDVTATTGIATAVRASAEAQKALAAYPNPTNGQALRVSLELAAAHNATFELVNALGQRVASTTRSLRAGSNQLELPTAGVAAGLYQLVVSRPDQPLLVQRVVVN